MNTTKAEDPGNPCQFRIHDTWDIFHAKNRPISSSLLPELLPKPLN